MTTNDHDLYATGLSLWTRWTAMWNGQPELARALVAPRFALHLPLPSIVDQATVCDPASVEAWVRAHCARFERLTFLPGIGPFVDVRAGIVAGPWHADTVIDGVARPACGMDTIAYRDGLIVEYWTISKPADGVGRWSERLAR